MHEPLKVRRPWIACVVLYALVAVHPILYQSESSFTYFSGMLIPSAATVWMASHGRRQGDQMAHGIQLIFFFTLPVSLVVYLTRIQGLAGFGLAIAHLVGLTATYLTAFYGWHFATVFFAVNQL